MGLIKEPQKIDFYVIDKTWSDVELNEFSEFIRQFKTQRLKRKFKPLKTKVDFHESNV